jgi:dipeptidase E
MKLYLSSLAIQNPRAYKALFGGVRNPKVAIVANAWGVSSPEESEPYIDMIKDQYKRMGITATQIDLLGYQNQHDELRADLSTYNGVWVTGGNTYYLNWVIHQCGFQNLIRDLCKSGFVYGGESAGAIVAGPTLRHFQAVDKPSEAPEIILEGMGLTNTVIVPHANSPEDGAAMKRIAAQLRQDGYEVALLADGQELIIDTNE